MKFEYFGNTGIQYFGNPDFTLDLTGAESLVYDDPVYGSASLLFAADLFFKKWLPLSLDGERNLLRVFFGQKAGHVFNVFALDTTIRDDDSRHTSLMQHDVAQELPIQNDLRQNNDIEYFYDKITVLQETEDWINKIYEERINEMVDDDPGYKGYNGIVAYKLFIASCIYHGTSGEKQFLPEIKILTDTAAATRSIDTSLIIDLGNSRTIGLIVEKDIATQKYHLANAAPLKLIDYDNLMDDGVKYLSEYENRNEGDEFDYLISSMLRFKKNIFDNYPSSESFQLPSIVCMGSEAENMEGSILDKSNTGISGPKRYLWCKKKEVLYWTFNNGEKIEGDVLKHILIDDSDQIINGALEPGLTHKPLRPTYPKRTMMVFAMIEIIYQAYCQINSIQYRKRVGNAQVKRSLKNIVLSFPTAMPYWERERYKKQVDKALFVLKKMKSIIGDDISISLGSDEASCSQLAFLFGEAQKFPHDTGNFINLVSQSRTDSKVRMASLDIGGGTTDLMIADYSPDNPDVAQDPNIVQNIIYSDGVTKAGDDILKHLIYRLVIPNIRLGLKNNSQEDRFEQYFGPGAPPANKQMRVEALYKFFMPIAEFYLHLMENKYEMQQGDLEDLDTLNKLNSYLSIMGLKMISKECVYLEENEIFKDEDFSMKIPNLVPSCEELERETLNIYSDVLARYAVVVNRYKPNFLILAGRTTALPIISEQLREWITISPNRIISLKDYYIGEWYPFSKQGIIKDPKTSVVIGNAIAHLSHYRLMDKVNIITQGEDSDYTLNFIGAVPSGKKLMDKHLIYKASDSSHSQSFQHVNNTSIIYRNIDDENMPCNLMYTLSLRIGENDLPYQPSNGFISITLDTSNPKEKLTLTSVDGEIEIPGVTGTKRNAEVDDIIFQEQTLFGDEYYLDNGKFDAFPPLVGE